MNHIYGFSKYKNWIFIFTKVESSSFRCVNDVAMDFGSESPPSRTIEKRSSDEKKPKKHYNFGVCLAQIQNIHKYTMSISPRSNLWVPKIRVLWTRGSRTSEKASEGDLQADWSMSQKCFSEKLIWDVHSVDFGGQGN